MPKISLQTNVPSRSFDKKDAHTPPPGAVDLFCEWKADTRWAFEYGVPEGPYCLPDAELHSIQHSAANE